MFENLSEREKKLVMVIGAVLPIVILFFAFMWFMDRYESNESDLDSLNSQIEIEKSKTRRGMLASQRQNYYRKASLPAKTNRVRSIYRNWLDDLIIKEAGMTHLGVKFRDNAGALIHERQPIANRVVFTARPKGTLPQLITFLHAFYSADHLHRINKLSIKPISVAKRGKAATLTGDLQMEFEIETLSLVDAPESIESFPVWNRELPEVETYSDRILARNIFGPANNKPSFKDPRKLKFTIAKSAADASGKFVTVQVTAADADKDDLLAFELLTKNPDVESGVVLGDQPRTASVRSISLKVPQQSAPTVIPISMKVSDDGLPAKEDTIEFKVVFEAPRMADVKPPKAAEPEPEPIEYANHTYVRGLVKGGDGRWVAIIVNQLTSQSLQKLAVDDSIEVDGETWKVVGVDKKSVTFEVDGERRSFKNGSNLAEPMKAL